MAQLNKHEHNQDYVLAFIVAAVVLLTVGQFVLYRNIQLLKTMISETAIELKQGIKTQTGPEELLPTSTDQSDDSTMMEGQ